MSSEKTPTPPRNPVLAGLVAVLDFLARHRTGLLWWNVVNQAGIIVTGAVVRVTSSGLGCPTWPECVDGSIMPTPEQAEGIHKLIEFGNRLLTFLLLIVAVLAFIAVRRQHRITPLSRTVRVLAVIPVLGVVAQAVLGGVTVLTGLNPWSVAAHLLLSAVLVVTSVMLLMRAGVGFERPAVPAEQRWLGRALIIALGVIFVLGTMVTGSGPHSGDITAGRMGFDIRTIATAHAAFVWLFSGLLAVSVVVVLRFGPQAARKSAALAAGLTVAEGAVGYAQYYLGVPEGLVLLHVLLSTLLLVSVSMVSEYFGALGQRD